MPEDISFQILAQASENIQKLFDLSTRIDERVKSVQAKQDHLDKRIDDTINTHIDLMKKIAVLEAHEEDAANVYLRIEYNSKIINELDKRVTSLEKDSGTHNDRWKSVATFVVQLVWIILAAYLLLKLNLQPPAVP